MDAIGLDKTRCIICESEHPFTAGFNNRDVRITTHYYPNDISFAMFSTIHEGGHAIYEMGMDDSYNYTSIAGGASMSIHESQSRFYENLIGRSRPFIEKVFPKMQELFPEQLSDVTAEQMYRAVNRVQPSLIRTESDELTYCMHIMIRYELEKQMMDGTLEVKDVPAAWNKLYKEYLGVDVPSDTKGCLQDSHWSGGSIGYFPLLCSGQCLRRADEARSGDRTGCNGRRAGGSGPDRRHHRMAGRQDPPPQRHVQAHGPVQKCLRRIRSQVLHRLPEGKVHEAV